MMLRAFHLRTRCPRSAWQGRLAGSICQRLCTSTLSENHHGTQSTQSSRHLCCRLRQLYGVRWRRRRRRCREESVLWADKLEVQRRRVRRVHLCRRRAPLQGVSGATRPQIICPQRNCAGIHLLIQWRVTELYGRNGVGGSKDAAKIVYSVYCDGFLTERKCTDACICCQPGGLARRFWGTASATGMPAI